MNNAERIVDLARSQIGIKELPANSNNVKYNTWYYGREVRGKSYPWCMTFDQWIYAHANCPLPYKTASCGGLLNWYRKNDPDCIVDTPTLGCIVIFDFPGGYETDHTGIYISSTSTTITTIDGNTGTGNEANGGAVMKRTRPKSFAKVKAYIKPRCLWEEDDMTGEEIYKALNEYLRGQELPSWAKKEFNEAIEAGVTDGSDPCTLIPRYQAALMAYRAMKKG